MAVFGSRGRAVISVEPVLNALTRDARPGLLVLLAAVVLLLVCAVANVANLQLARAAARRREMGIRAALGAPTGRLVRQLVVEHVDHRPWRADSPACCSRARPWRSCRRSSPPACRASTSSPWTGRSPSSRSPAPASPASRSACCRPWEVRRLDFVETLNEDGLAPSGSGVRLRAARLRAGVMIAQVAAAAVLLVGGALLTRSFLALAARTAGSRRAECLTATLPLPDAGYTPARETALLETLAARVKAVPGVRAVGFTTELPLSGSVSLRAFEMPARRGAPLPTALVQSALRLVSPGYFAGARPPCRRGPGALSDDDTATSRHAVVVNRAFARAYLDVPAVGRLIPAGWNDVADWEVVGVWTT